MQCIVPLPILELIIRALPLEYAVKTRTVSKQWKEMVDKEMQCFRYFRYLWDQSPKEGRGQTGLLSMDFATELKKDKPMSEKQERRLFKLIARKIHWSFRLEEAKDFEIEFGKGTHCKEPGQNWSYDVKYYTLVLRVKDLKQLTILCVRADVFTPDYDDYYEEDEDVSNEPKKKREILEGEQCLLCNKCHKPLHCPLVQDGSSEDDEDDDSADEEEAEDDYGRHEIQEDDEVHEETEMHEENTESVDT